MRNLKVLAIDASTKNTGIAFFENNKLKHYQCIPATGELINRIKKITKRVEEIYDKYQPSNIIMQQVLPQHVGYNQSVFKALIYLQAYIVISLYQKQKQIDFYIPGHWRKLCGIKTGQGIKRNQLKNASQKWVKDKYGIEVNDDISDAICLGYAYIQQFGSAF